MGWGRWSVLLGVVLLGCDDPTPKADPPEPIVLPPHVPGEYPGPCLREEYYYGSQTPSSSIRTGYDARGRVTLWELVDERGHTFSREERSYDALDREVETDELWSIRHYDGTGYDRWTRHARSYDSAGNVVRHVQDYNRDGSSDVVTTRRWDAAGNEVEERIEQASPQVPDYLRLSTFDRDGNRTRLILEVREAGRVKQTTVEWRYEAGELVEQTWDNESDGLIDGREVRERDAEGRLIDFWRDEDNDGIPEWRYTHRYSEDGREHFFEEDADGDGSIDSSFVHITSEDGRSFEERNDLDGDGRIDLIIRGEDDPGRKYVSYDDDADGQIDLAFEYTWEPGNPAHALSESDDHDGDGVFDTVKTWRYGPFGVEGTETVDATGAIISQEPRTYDSVGNLLRIDSPEYGVRYSYICPWSPFER